MRCSASTGAGLRHVSVIAIGKGAAVLAVVTDLQFTVDDLDKLAKAALKQVARIH